MKTEREGNELSREELLDLVAELQRRVADLVAQVAELTATNGRLQEGTERLRSENAELRREIDTLKRGGSRLASPYSKGKPLPDPKRPGRKPGQGAFAYRKPPDPSEVTERIRVPVRHAACPSCGGALKEEGTDLAWVSDLPERPKPVVTEYQVSVCRCEACGQQVRGEHEAIAPDQWGATAHRLGPRVKEAAHALHYGLGIPERKVPEVLSRLAGIEVTQSALTQDALRQAEDPAPGSIGATYETLRASVRESAVVNTDDTSWAVGGERAFLMGFETPEAVVYQIRSQHRNEEVRELIPSDYAGVMGCDRGKSYDALALSDVRQQKCLCHADRDLVREIELRESGGRSVVEGSLPQGLRAELRDAEELWRQFRAGAIDRERYDREGARLRGAISVRLVAETVRLHFLPPESWTPCDRGNQRLLDQIGRHHFQGNLVRFLEDPAIEPTNNRAERMLRPAVIARKVSHCSKTVRGARAFSAWVSVLATRRKRAAQEAVSDPSPRSAVASLWTRRPNQPIGPAPPLRLAAA